MSTEVPDVPTMELTHDEAVVLDLWLPALLTYSLMDDERASLLNLQARITDFLTPAVAPMTTAVPPDA